MGKFHKDRYRRSSGKAKFVVVFILCLLLLIFVSVFAGYKWYNAQLQPKSNDTAEVIVTIEEGDTAYEIANVLQSRGLIRSAKVFDYYVRLTEQRMILQAGSYKMSPSMSLEEIVKKLVKGEVATDLVTILPAQRLDQIKAVFLMAGYTPAEVQEAFRVDQYLEHPALSGMPLENNLEGLLYPESYQRQSTTKLSEIIGQSLDLTAKSLTKERLEIYSSYGLNQYQALTMASIIEREVNNPEDRDTVAQVFLKRFKEGMQLGSDPTALYGALVAGIEPAVSADTPYNTRLYVGLPPGPINNVSDGSLKSLAYPAKTDYLFFVSGDDGKTYFSRTLQEHEALTAQHCIELCKSY